MRRLLCTILLSGLLAVAGRAATTLQLDPANGVLFANAGATVGWGFTITNDTNYLVVTGSDFTPSSIYGTYEDYIGTANFIVVGPAPESSPVSQPFNSVAMTGVGAFHVSPVAPPTKITGTLSVFYSLFSVSPNDENFNPDTDLILAEGTLSQPAEVNVVPEPSTLLLFGAAAVPFLIARHRRTRN